jgi:Family of unknown function (DUF6459)
MLAEQALTQAAPPDEELAALQPVEVPGHWPPGRPAGPALPPCPPPRDGGVPRAAPAEPGQPSPHQFALLIVETLAGVRPVRQLAPLLSKRAAIHLHRLLPLFSVSRRPRVLRVLTSAPATGVVEMTLIVETGPRTRALAVRLERAARTAAARRDAPATRWLCTAIEAA